MLRIDLVYEEDDAQTAAVRASLRDALHMLDMAPRWNEVRASAGPLPPVIAAAPRPTVVVEGELVGSGGPPSRAQILMKLQDALSWR
ncbi:MAG: hypothetical protein H6732_02300 [Alphaproteobacteria bacterium]|nr:hypothetical protein [Alphaproteobacteria bacterium]